MQGMIHVIYILIDYILNPTTFLYAFFKYQSHDLFMSFEIDLGREKYWYVIGK
jgi:hypothetical protein